MQVVLAMFRGENDRRSFSLHKDMTVIGRREDCDLRIPLGSISRKHCRLIKDGDTLKIEDLGSSNGTFHNGQRVQEATLSAGDTIQVGSIAFVVQLDGVPADDELQPIYASTAAAASSSEGSGDPVEDSGAPQGAGAAIDDDGDFDPMSVLQAGDDSGADAAPAINPDDSAAPGFDIDLEESEKSA